MMLPNSEKVKPSPVPGDSPPEDRQAPQTGRDNDAILTQLAHELRDPLGCMRSALEVLQMRRGDPSTQDWACGVFDRRIHHMSHLIEELLELSGISHGKVHLQKRLVDLAEVADAAIETARPSIEERGHVLTVNLPSGTVTLEADPSQLEQVLTNLLTNAAKYTAPGGRIWLTAESAGDDIVMRVRDSGIGIAAEALPHVFDLYWQSSPAAGHCLSGLGIGLTLVRQLVEIHGGSVRASSDGPGQGSEFVVRLPRTTSTDNRHSR